MRTQNRSRKNDFRDRTLQQTKSWGASAATGEHGPEPSQAHPAQVTEKREISPAGNGGRCPARIDPTLDFMMFAKSQPLPEGIEELCSLRRTLDFRLQSDFLATLTDAERKNLNAGGLTSASLNKWDEIIIEAAGRYGTLIMLSDQIQRTVHRWRTSSGDAGSVLLRRFLTAILEETEVRWGLRKDPITDQYARFKPHVVKDLRKLQDELQKSGLHNADHVIELSKRLITGDEYPALAQNRSAFFIFLKFNPQIALGFGGGREQRLMTPDGDPVERVSAPDFYYHLVAYSTNRTFESVRQAISRASARIGRR